MIRTFLVDRVRLVAEVVGAALEGEPDIQVVGIATGVAEALERLAATPCDAVLVSTSLPDGGALSLVSAIRERHPQVKTLVMGLADSEGIILRYIEAGAAGYILREEGVDVLLSNLRAAVEERALISPRVAARLMARIAELSDKLAAMGMDPGDYEQLTPREREILGLIGQGLNNQAIAERLHIEVGTVKNHVHNILRKLNVASRKDAALYLSLVEGQEPAAGPDPER